MVRLRIQNLRIHQNLVHIQLLKMGQRPWKVTLLNHIAILGEVDDVVYPSVERLPTVRLGENLWIPFVGCTVRGKHNVTGKELTETAFGMDLHGVTIANPKPRSIWHLTVEVVEDQSLMNIGIIVPDEKPTALLRVVGLHVRRRGQHGVTSFSSPWKTVKH